MEEKKEKGEKPAMIKFDLEKIEKITLGGLFKILTHIEIKILALLVTFIVGYSIGLIQFGQLLQIENVAIPLNIPFQIDVAINSGDEFILSKNPSKPLFVEDGKNGVYIRRKNSLGVFNEVGKLVTSKAQLVSIRFGNIISVLGAQESFDWIGYKDRKDFTEIIMKDNIVVRTYSDGKILQYTLNSSGQYIHGTLHWVN